MLYLLISSARSAFSIRHFHLVRSPAMSDSAPPHGPKRSVAPPIVPISRTRCRLAARQKLSRHQRGPCTGMSLSDRRNSKLRLRPEGRIRHRWTCELSVLASHPSNMHIPVVPLRNARVIFKEIPKGRLVLALRKSARADRTGLQDFPVPGNTTVMDTTRTIYPDAVPLNGGFLLETLVLTVEPCQRGRMRAPAVLSYAIRIRHYFAWIHT